MAKPLPFNDTLFSFFIITPLPYDFLRSFTIITTNIGCANFFLPEGEKMWQEHTKIGYSSRMHLLCLALGGPWGPVGGIAPAADCRSFV